MAVPAGPTEKRYTGNGVTTIYTIPFLLILATDLEVFIDGVKQTSGYVVIGAGNPTSTITFTTAPANGAGILLQLNVPFERLNDYQENGDFLAATVNRDFDRIWQALKQLFRWSTRSLRLGDFDVDGQGMYRAKGNGIADLKDPVQMQDAATKNWAQNLIASILATGQGPINNAANVVYVGPRAEHIGVVQDMSDMTDPMKGAGLIGYSGRKLAEHLGDWVSIKQYGVKGDGTDHPDLMNIALQWATAAKKAVYIPTAPDYITSGNQLQKNMKVFGEHWINTRIRLADGANRNIFWWDNTGPGADYYHISGLHLNGNWKDEFGVVKNTSGGGLQLIGYRGTFTDCVITNSADNAVVTDFKAAGLPPGYGDDTGAQGFFQRITITKVAKTCWVHYGPTDSQFDSIEGIDSSLLADGVYDGFEFYSNGRFTNLHYSNSSASPAIPAAGVRFHGNGSNVVNGHFEGGYIPCLVLGAGNDINGSFYAPRGDHCVSVPGTGNRFTGTMGLTYAGANPNYKGFALLGSNNNINVTDVGCLDGAIDFAGDLGGNMVRVTGYHSSGVAYTGLPHAKDDVLIMIDGPGGGTLRQELPIPLNTYTPVVSNAGGLAMTYTSSGSYRKNGSGVVTYDVEVVINTVAAGSPGPLQITLPIPAAYDGLIAGQEQNLTGASCSGRIQASVPTIITVVKYDNSSVVQAGAKIVLSGHYLVAV
ncbi:hypothetical protein [Pseudomonas vranovensis]|uniref:hypothetical protein n=1 Tax=Pseudomonas vranovensis TaxID=321661 RepID=UPI003D99F813